MRYKICLKRDIYISKETNIHQNDPRRNPIFSLDISVVFWGTKHESTETFGIYTKDTNVHQNNPRRNRIFSLDMSVVFWYAVGLFWKVLLLHIRLFGDYISLLTHVSEHCFRSRNVCRVVRYQTCPKRGIYVANALSLAVILHWAAAKRVLLFREKTDQDRCINTSPHLLYITTMHAIAGNALSLVVMVAVCSGEKRRIQTRT